MHNNCRGTKFLPQKLHSPTCKYGNEIWTLHSVPTVTNMDIAKSTIITFNQKDAMHIHKHNKIQISNLEITY